jgi:sulfane dehydrogenase subunit SoxC
VEVSVDGGKHWAEAKLQGPIHRMAHTRFSIPWAWQGEEAMLMSRCLDDAGEMQPTLDWLGQMRGVNRDWWLTTKTWINHFNPIQPWKVKRDGTIENAMFA